ncbi:hypothetical protein ACH5RR_012623 [Cinchona calisaya]|uniref:Uncharacterized protein n=1 Tax=Cinchona calisaya TaxID=153742 RepID=A0ABD3A8B5_9GENT
MRGSIATHQSQHSNHKINEENSIRANGEDLIGGSNHDMVKEEDYFGPWMKFINKDHLESGDGNINGRSPEIFLVAQSLGAREDASFVAQEPPLKKPDNTLEITRSTGTVSSSRGNDSPRRRMRKK